MPRKKKHSDPEDTGIEMPSLSSPSPAREDDTPHRSDWDLCDDDDDNSSTATPIVRAPDNTHSDNVLTPVYSAFTAASRVFSSAISDLGNRSEYIGPLTSIQLSSALSGLHPSVSLPLRFGFESAYYVLNQITATLPSLYSMDTAPARPPVRPADICTRQAV